MKENWTYKKLGEIISPARVVRKGDSENFPILSITMKEGIILQADRFKKIIASIDTSSYKVVENGQLVIAFPIDEGLIYTQDIVDKGIMSPAYNIWDVDYSEMNRRFLIKYLHGPYAMKYYKSKLRGTTMRRRSIPKSDLLALTIPVPSVEEQERIAEELDLLSGVIEKQKQQLKELDTLAQSIFYDTFGDPITNEKNWPVKKLGEIGDIVSGSTPSTKDNSNWDGDVNWVTPAELGTQLYYGNTVRKITEKAAKKLTIMPIGTVLLSSRAPIGKLAITTAPMCCNQGFKNIICGEKLNNIFLYYCLYFSMDNIKSLGRGATFKEVSKSGISSFIVPFPPLSLQEEFAEKIELIEKQKEAISQSIKETQQLFDYTMDKYFG